MPDADVPRFDGETRAAQRAAVEVLGKWVHDRMIDRLTHRSDSTDFRLEAIWPVIVDWYAEPAPGVDQREDWLSLEVAFQTGGDDDDYPIEPPDGLSETAQWFNIDFLRTPNVPVEGGAIQTSAGLSAWFAPTPRLLAMLDDPEWDTGNLLGFDCLGVAGPDAREWCRQPAVAKIVDAFAGLEPAAVVVFDHVGDELLYPSGRPARPHNTVEGPPRG